MTTKSFALQNIGQANLHVVQRVCGVKLPWHATSAVQFLMTALFKNEVAAALQAET